MAVPATITAALNGTRLPGSHPRLPITTADLVAEAVAVSAAGAAALHIHVRGSDGMDTIDPGIVDATVRAIKRACPDVPVCVSTRGSAGLDSTHRADSIRAWTEPQSASVALFEPGYYAAMDAALDAGLRVDVGVATPADVQRLMRTGMVDEVDRVLVQPAVAAAVDPRELVRAVERALDASAVRAPRFHGGSDANTWDVVRAAVAMGRDIRIGLADTLTGVDGRPAASNAALVRMARKIVES